jgi:predicted S18 family serine protease
VKENIGATSSKFSDLLKSYETFKQTKEKEQEDLLDQIDKETQENLKLVQEKDNLIKEGNFALNSIEKKEDGE